MKLRAIILCASLAALSACGEAPQSTDDKGQIGASSGPNPNLTDIQAETPTPEATKRDVPPEETGGVAGAGPNSGANAGATGPEPQTSP